MPASNALLLLFLEDRYLETSTMRSRSSRIYPVGAKARFAFALIRYLGVHSFDVMNLGKGMEGKAIGKSGREIEVTRFKVRKNSRKKPKPGKPASGPKRPEMPILPELCATIDAMSSTHMTYLVTKFGRPFVTAGFGSMFRKWRAAAGPSHCAAHGIHGYDAIMAAENGATERRLTSMLGWDDLKQAATCTRKARQKKLERSSMHLMTTPGQNNKIGQVSHRSGKR